VNKGVLSCTLIICEVELDLDLLGGRLLKDPFR
jgi:hypothetical protein